MNLSEERDFRVDTSSLREIRSFAREVISKSTVLSACSDDLVLALAEAAQNIVKHAYNGQPTNDLLKVKISFKDNDLSMELFDRGKPVVPANIKPRNLEDIKAGGLGTFFIGQIMDEVVFKTTKVDWVNHLVLTKKF